MSFDILDFVYFEVLTKSKIEAMGMYFKTNIIIQ